MSNYMDCGHYYPAGRNVDDYLSNRRDNHQIISDDEVKSHFEKRKQAAEEQGKLEEFLREERHKKAGISYTYVYR